MRHKEQRVGIFIDVQNLYHSSKNLFHARVNYKELLKELVAGRQLIRAIGYVVKTNDAPSAGGDTKAISPEAAFFDALEKAGVELRMKDIQIFAGGAKKADWDVGMAVDAIRMSDFLDVVILVTGDGDFVPLVEYIKWGRGRMVEVAAFSRSCSARLKEVADIFVNIEDVPKAILRPRRSGGATSRANATPTGDGAFVSPETELSGQ